MRKKSKKIEESFMPQAASDKQWPAELDALIAAPEHHKLLFENEWVRALDTSIPTGHMTHVHVHQFPSAPYFLSWSDFIRYDAEGNVIVDSRTLAKIPAVGAALWSGPPTPHALKNIGTNDLHVISVEVKMKILKQADR